MMTSIQELLQPVFEWVGRSGDMAAVYFMAVYTVATFLFIPIVLLNTAAGLLFGVVPGALISAFASTISSTIAYLVTHYFLRNWVQGKIEKYRSIKVIDNVIHKGGWKIVFLLRLAPILPFVALNAAYGVSRVKYWKFISASFLGFLPASFLYAYVGSVVGNLIEERAVLPGEKYFFIASVLAAVLATAYMTKIARKIIASSHAGNVA